MTEEEDPSSADVQRISVISTYVVRGSSITEKIFNLQPKVNNHMFFLFPPAKWLSLNSASGRPTTRSYGYAATAAKTSSPTATSAAANGWGSLLVRQARALARGAAHPSGTGRTMPIRKAAVFARRDWRRATRSAAAAAARRTGGPGGEVARRADGVH